MHIICLATLAPGVYNDHGAEHITCPPAGWAYIPEDFPLPSTFPCLGSLEAEERTHTKEGENGETFEFTCMTVTAMTEGTLPEPSPEPVDEPSVWDEMATAIEEGVNDV